MNTKQAAIQLHDVNEQTLPNYVDYAYAIDKVKTLLETKVGQAMQLYTSDESVDFFDHALEQMIEAESADLEVIAPVFAEVVNHKIVQNNEEFTITPSLENNIFYFPRFEVAFVQIPIYQTHADMCQDIIFAPSHEKVLTFMNEIFELTRKAMLNGITVLTDTEYGVKQTKEMINHQITREEVLLDESIKRDIFRSIDEFFTAERTFFKKYNIPYKRGVLLYGLPGNGKTTLVKSIAGSVDAPVIYWQITEHTESYSIEEVFTKASKLAPVILIIEDIDSMPYDARSTFLNALDGATSKEGVFLIGTTNYPEKIDPALINRAGRFDRAYEIKQPDDALRLDYLQRKDIAKFIGEENITLAARKTKGLSIAQLNELYMSMALEWHYDQQVNIDKIITELKENHRKAMQQEWEMEDYEERVGF